MKTQNIIWFCIVFAAISSSVSAQGGYSDDLYGAPRKTTSTKKERTERKAQRQQAYNNNYYSSYQANDKIYNELVTSYQEALARRVDAFNNDELRPESYLNLMDEYRDLLLAKYDPNLYNVIEFNNMMWVEPQDITALFDGSDPAEGVKKYAQNHKKMVTAQSQSGKQGNNPTIQLNIVSDPYPWYNSYSPYYYGNKFWGAYPYGYALGMGWGIGLGIGYSAYFDPYWGFGSFWGSSWGYPMWGGGHYWGHYPQWGCYPGWGHNYPGWGGGNSGSSRPVIHGSGGRYDNAFGSPSLRPGGGGGLSSEQRPAFRRGSGGTNIVNYNTTERSMRPGSSSNSGRFGGTAVRPNTTSRPSSGVQVSRPSREQWQSSQSSQPSRPSSSPSVNRPSSSPSMSRPTSSPSMSRPSGGGAPSRGGGRR